MNSYSFKEASEVGAIAVSRVTRWLNERWNVMTVLDVQDDKRFQIIDVDLLVVLFNGKYLLIEVKGDRYTTGNFFIELVSNIGLNSEGCIAATRSDYIIYYFTNMDRMFLLDTKLLQKWTIDNAHRFKTKTLNTESLYETKGIAVPIEILMKEGCGRELDCSE